MAHQPNPAQTRRDPSGGERVQPDCPLSGEVKRGGATSLDGEEWRPVIGYEGFYEVSNLARVRSVARTKMTERNGWPLRITVRRKILRACINTSGYLQVQFTVNLRYDTRSVHRLVLEAFVGPPPFPGAVCRHLNDCRLDNSVQNLAWGTAQDNANDALRNGGVLQGERHPRVRLSDLQIAEMLESVRAGTSHRTAAKAYGVTHGYVSHLLRDPNLRAASRKLL